MRTMHVGMGRLSVRRFFCSQQQCDNSVSAHSVGSEQNAMNDYAGSSDLFHWRLCENGLNRPPFRQYGSYQILLQFSGMPFAAEMSRRLPRMP